MLLRVHIYLPYTPDICDVSVIKAGFDLKCDGISKSKQCDKSSLTTIDTNSALKLTQTNSDKGI